MIGDATIAETMFRALGDRLAEAGSSATIVVLGGVAMNLHGFVDRPTRDVDVLARRDEPDGPLRHPDPLPQPLRDAIGEVALDFDAPPDWMNTAVALADAAEWIRTQDTSPEFHTIVERVIEYVHRRVE